MWINQAREYGTANRVWRPTTVLRDPPKNNVIRRGFGRVVADTNRLVDMATVSVLRHQHLQRAGSNQNQNLRWRTSFDGIWMRSARASFTPPPRSE
ncbi:hypothetical protein [Nocardia sp. MW-W600-9]